MLVHYFLEIFMGTATCLLLTVLDQGTNVALDIIITVFEPIRKSLRCFTSVELSVKFKQAAKSRPSVHEAVSSSILNTDYTSSISEAGGSEVTSDLVVFSYVLMSNTPRNRVGEQDLIQSESIYLLGLAAIGTKSLLTF